MDAQNGVVVRKDITDALVLFAEFCGVDIFILGPKHTPTADGLNGDAEVIQDSRWRVAIYGDVESTVHAKTHVLIFIDKLVRLNSHVLCGLSYSTTAQRPLQSLQSLYQTNPFTSSAGNVMRCALKAACTRSCVVVRAKTSS